MTAVIEVLRREHCNIERLLCVLERQLNVFDRGGRPDYEIFQAVIEYFKDYPDSCHHPKEDLIFEKLQARNPLAAEMVGDLQAEHRKEAARLERIAQVVDAVLGDQDFVRLDVDAIIRDFIDHERQHMVMEERTVFPAALKALLPADWADVALKFADRYDPLSQPSPEWKHERLRRSILEMEEQAEAERRTDRKFV
jgi:hemerythrin-like domain-containing protein